MEESQAVSVDPETAEVESVVMTETEVEALRLMQLEDKQMTDASVSNETPEGSTEAPQRGFKRVKSLQVAVGVLQFLEKDFCSPKRAMRGKEGGLLSPSQKASESEEAGEVSITKEEQMVRTPRSSRSMPLTPRSGSISAKEDEPKPPKPTVVVPPKSKALLKLLEARKAEENGNSPKAENSNPGTPRPSPFGGRKVNFLGELQNRFQRKTASSETENSEQPSTPVSTKKPMNFLDELKTRRAENWRRKIPVTMVKPRSP